jgi:hypothetical protein
MENTTCHYCKEEIKAEALICKHCHERLSWLKEELVMAAISAKIQAAAVSVAIPSVSACGALCHSKFAGNKARLKECLDDCKAAEAVALVAEKLHKELVITFADIVWGGGDIDPVPFEKAVRERFSRPGIP